MIDINLKERIKSPNIAKITRVRHPNIAVFFAIRFLSSNPLSSVNERKTMTFPMGLTMTKMAVNTIRKNVYRVYIMFCY